MAIQGINTYKHYMYKSYMVVIILTSTNKEISMQAFADRRRLPALNRTRSLWLRVNHETLCTNILFNWFPELYFICFGRRTACGVVQSVCKTPITSMSALLFLIILLLMIIILKILTKFITIRIILIKYTFLYI